MHLTITQVDRALFDGEALSVTVPGVEGEMTILPHHTALISPLQKGTVTARSGEKEEQFPIEKGLLEISNNQVTVLI